MQSNKTNGEIVVFLNFCQSYLANDKDDVPLHPDSKFKYAMQKMQRRCTKLYDRYQESLADNDIAFCATDKDGVVMRDTRGSFEFKKDDLLKRNQKIRELRDTEVSFEMHVATEPPPKPLSFDEQCACEGFVLKELENE